MTIVRRLEWPPGLASPGAWCATGRSGRVGSVSHVFEVQAGRLAHVDDGSQRRPGDALDDPSRPIPAGAARRVLPGNVRPFYYQVDLFNGAEREAASGQPEVLAGWTVPWLRRPDALRGGAVRMVHSTRGRTEPQGSFRCRCRGGHELVLELRDGVSGAPSGFA